jgi:hypothetical protein
MITKILTTEDVKLFAKQLISEDLNFHPDDDFTDYVNLTTKLPSYSSEDAVLRNQLMSECFDVCQSNGADIYEIMMKELFPNQDLAD